jgi:hypothetical protein
VSLLAILSVVGGAALAGPVFGQASEETLLDLDGNWPRAFVDRERPGFLMFHAGGGDYKLTHVTTSLRTDHFDDRMLTGRRDLKDHDIRPCPDGTWLHVATGDVNDDHDSAWAWRYDANFAIESTATIAEASTDGSNYVDVPVVCGQEFQGFAYAFPPARIPARFAVIGADAAVNQTVDLHYGPFATGASLINDRDGTVWIIGGYTEVDKPMTKLVVAQYDTAWEVGAHRLIEVAPEGYEIYWSQATIRVGGYFIVAHMMRDTASNWTQQDGNLTLSAFDGSTWDFVDQVQLSQNTAPTGGMQPYVMFDEASRLLALYSKDLHNYGFIVDLQPEVLATVGDTGQGGPGDDTGDDTGDTATPDSGVSDSGDPDGASPIDTGDGKDPTDCGCAAGAPSAVHPGVAFGVSALRARRRRAA